MKIKYICLCNMNKVNASYVFAIYVWVEAVKGHNSKSINIEKHSQNYT